jgi:hypothetical protein
VNKPVNIVKKANNWALVSKVARVTSSTVSSHEHAAGEVMES